MPAFLVRFKGIKTGRPIYTVRVEADSEDEAVQAVKAALDPDAANFSCWESKPA